MNRLIAALTIVLAFGFAPASHAQEECDEQALEAGECGGDEGATSEGEAQSEGEAEDASAIDESAGGDGEPGATDEAGAGDAESSSEGEAAPGEESGGEEAASEESAAAGAEGGAEESAETADSGDQVEDDLGEVAATGESATEAEPEAPAEAGGEEASETEPATADAAASESGESPGEAQTGEVQTGAVDTEFCTVLGFPPDGEDCQKLTPDMAARFKDALAKAPPPDKALCAEVGAAGGDQFCRIVTLARDMRVEELKQKVARLEEMMTGNSLSQAEMEACAKVHGEPVENVDRGWCAVQQFAASSSENLCLMLGIPGHEALCGEVMAHCAKEESERIKCAGALVMTRALGCMLGPLIGVGAAMVPLGGVASDGKVTGFAGLGGSCGNGDPAR